MENEDKRIVTDWSYADWRVLDGINFFLGVISIMSIFMVGISISALIHFWNVVPK